MIGFLAALNRKYYLWAYWHRHRDSRSFRQSVKIKSPPGPLQSWQIRQEKKARAPLDADLKHLTDRYVKIDRFLRSLAE